MSLRSCTKRLKRELALQLKKFNLGVNEWKTEEYKISSESSDEWENASFLDVFLTWKMASKEERGKKLTHTERKRKS